MYKFILKRTAGAFVTLFIIVTVCFFLLRLVPGGPFDAERALSDAVKANIEAKYHLNDPILKQYTDYLLGVFTRLDFGPSYKYNDYDVNYYISKTLPNSLILGAGALALALLMGMLVGIISSVKQNTWADYLTMSVAVIGISVPLFVIGPVLMYIFATKWQILPTSGWISGEDGWLTIIMPLITLAFPYFATIARLFRASMLEVLRSDYIRTAKAKGLSSWVIIVRHVLKGAFLPVLSYLGPAFAAIITGSVVVEQIFRVPGMGAFFVKSALNRDYTLLMGVIIVYSAILICMNLVVDLIYLVFDPRISYE